MDGGAVSSLPIEAAISQGAAEIIALDLGDPTDGNGKNHRLGNFFVQLDKTVESRHKKLELELAKTRGGRVRRVLLTGVQPVQIWDFRQSVGLIERGYQLTQQAIKTWPAADRSSHWNLQDVETILEEILEVLD